MDSNVNYLRDLNIKEGEDRWVLVLSRPVENKGTRFIGVSNGSRAYPICAYCKQAMWKYEVGSCKHASTKCKGEHKQDQYPLNLQVHSKKELVTNFETPFWDNFEGAFQNKEFMYSTNKDGGPHKASPIKEESKDEEPRPRKLFIIEQSPGPVSPENMKSSLADEIPVATPSPIKKLELQQAFD